MASTTFACFAIESTIISAFNSNMGRKLIPETEEPIQKTHLSSVDHRSTSTILVAKSILAKFLQRNNQQEVCGGRGPGRERKREEKAK
jgi:hypothetical protein